MRSHFCQYTYRFFGPGQNCARTDETFDHLMLIDILLSKALLRLRPSEGS